MNRWCKLTKLHHSCLDFKKHFCRINVTVINSNYSEGKFIYWTVHCGQWRDRVPENRFEFGKKRRKSLLVQHVFWPMALLKPKARVSSFLIIHYCIVVVYRWHWILFFYRREIEISTSLGKIAHEGITFFAEFLFHLGVFYDLLCTFVISLCMWRTLTPLAIFRIDVLKKGLHLDDNWLCENAFSWSIFISDCS